MRPASDGTILFEGSSGQVAPISQHVQPPDIGKLVELPGSRRSSRSVRAARGLTCLNQPIRKLKTEGSSYTLLCLLLVLPTYSPEGPSFPEMALNRIDTIFFPHVPVCRPIRPFTPQTLLDLL